MTGNGRTDAARTVEIASHSVGGTFPWDGGAVVVVDVIRSTTTAITAVERGRRCFAATNVGEALEIAARLPHPLVVGELRGESINGFEVGNSPAAIAARTDVERPLVLLSSSGTALMAAAGVHSPSALVACLRNVQATIDRIVAERQSVVLIGAETRGQFRDEDLLCCARIAGGLMDVGFTPVGGTEEIVRRHRDRPTQDIAAGASARYLERSGQTEDLRFILEHVDDLGQAFRLCGAEVVAVADSPATLTQLPTAAGHPCRPIGLE